MTIPNDPSSRLSWRRRKWSEANPSAELTDFRMIDGIIYGTVLNSNVNRYPNGQAVIIESYVLHEYKDHYFIVKGKRIEDCLYFIAYKKNERIT